MVQYRDLNAPPSRMLADVVADMKASERQSKTGEAGVKDLGDAGDVVWSRPDGGSVSVRDVDLDLEDARARIGEAEQGLAQTQVRLDDAEQTVTIVQGDLTELETVTLPGAVAGLEAADQAAQQELSTLDGKLTTAFPDGPFSVPAEFGETIYRQDVQYAVSASETQPPTSGWSADSPTRQPGEFIWFRTLITYGDGSTSLSSAALMTGNTGAQGEQGVPGVPGEDGTSVTINGSLDSEADLPASGNPGDGYLIDGYLWVWDGSAWTNVGLIRGPQGVPGEPGENGEPTFTWVKYADTSAGQGMSDDPINKRFIGLSFNNLSPVESTDPADYQWARFEGPKGDQGVSVESIIPHYRLEANSAPRPAQPSGMNPSGWSTQEPGWVINSALYRAERVVYDNGVIVWTPVTLVAAHEGIDRAILDARNAWNEAVEAQEAAQSALSGAENKVQNPSFEYDGTGSTAGLSPGYISTERARTGSRSFVVTGYGSAVLGETVTVAPPSIWRFSAWVFIDPETEYRGQLNGGLRLQYRATSQDPWPTGMAVNINVQDHNVGHWFPLKAELQIPAGVTQIRARMAFGYSQNVTVYVDDVSLIDVTDIVQLEASADAAQARADEAMAEAESKATPAEVTAAASAAEEAAKTAAAADAKAKADQAKADALAGAATDAKSKADAAQAAAIAAASADAATKANQALQDALEALATARGEITAEIKASANGKNSITISTSAPGSTQGVVIGDTWWRVDGNSNIYGQWMWKGDSWVARQIRSEVIANLDVHKLQVTGDAKIAEAVIDKLFAETFVAHKITGSELSISSVKPDGTLADGSVSAVTIKDGAITTPKLTVTEDMSAAIVNAMSVNAKKLVVSDEAILNKATLIGQTVVDDINVQGKLVGVDGVFTGTVDFENVNVTGELLASEISGEHIYGTVLEGGEIRTSDELPGQVSLRDDGYVEGNGTPRPGIRINPTSTYNPDRPPGIGPNANGLIITGGTTTSGEQAYASLEPLRATLVSRNVQTGRESRVQAFGSVAEVTSRAASGSSTRVRAAPEYADIAIFDDQNDDLASIWANYASIGLSGNIGGITRMLQIDADGVWVRTNRSGSEESWNLEETANDTGWINFNAHTGISTGASPALRLKGGIVWAQGYVTRPAGWASGWTRVAGPFATWLRPTRDMLRYGATTATQRLLVRMTSTGYLEVWWSAAAPGDYQVDLSVLSYPNT